MNTKIRPNDIQQLSRSLASNSLVRLGVAVLGPGEGLRVQSTATARLKTQVKGRAADHLILAFKGKESSRLSVKVLVGRPVRKWPDSLVEPEFTLEITAAGPNDIGGRHTLVFACFH